MAAKVGAGRETPGWSYLRHVAQPSAPRIPAMRHMDVMSTGRHTETCVDLHVRDERGERESGEASRGMLTPHLLWVVLKLVIRCVCVRMCVFLCVHRHRILCRHVLHGCVT